MPFSPAAQAALLKWVNTFPIDQPAEAMSDLADGITLSQVLHDLDPTYDPSELDRNSGSSRWLTQKRNLQSVYKGLFRYMRREAPECVPLTRVADFRSIAENPDPAGLSQLVAVFLATAVFNSDDEKRQVFINKLQKDFGPNEQNEIRRVVQEKQGEMAELAKAAALEDAQDAAGRDPDLEDEEERLRLVAELERKVRELDTATKRYADLNTRHLYLQESHDELKAKLGEVESELESVKKLIGDDESQRVQALSQKIEEQAALIATQEEEIDAYQTRQRQLEVDLAAARTASDEGAAYKDRCDELTHQIADLERRANAADRYKQKLAAQRNLEQEVASLQYELEARRELDDNLKRALAERDRLQATEREMLAAMATIETSLSDERDRKEHYKELYEELRADFTQLEHQNSVNEKYIEEMKSELGAGGELLSPRSPGSGGEGATGLGIGSLEQELQQTTSDLAKFKMLEAENEVLRHGAAVSGYSDELRRQLEQAKAERDIAVKKYEAIYEKHGVAQEQIDALMKNMTGEGLVLGVDEALKHGPLALLTSDFYRSTAFNNLREAGQRTQAELDELRTRHRQLEETVKDKDREVLSMKTDCALLEEPRYVFPGHEQAKADYDDTVDAVGEDRLEALEKLKQSDQLIAASLRAELEALRSKYNALEVENNMHKSQLLEALVAKEKLSKERDLAEPASAAAEPAAAADSEAVNNYKSKAEKLRDRLKSAKEVTTSVRSSVVFTFSTPVTRVDPSSSAIVSPGSPRASSERSVWPIFPRRSSSVLGSVTEEPSGSSPVAAKIPAPLDLADRAAAEASTILRRVTPPPEMVAFKEDVVKKNKRRSWFGMRGSATKSTSKE